MEHFMFDHTAFSEFFSQLFQSDDFLNDSHLGEIELVGGTPNVWKDMYVDYAPNAYDEYIDRVQDKIVMNRGLTPERASIMQAVDYWQRILHHPELRTELNAMTDAQIKQEIADLLGIKG